MVTGLLQLIAALRAASSCDPPWPQIIQSEGCLALQTFRPTSHIFELSQKKKMMFCHLRTPSVDLPLITAAHAANCPANLLILFAGAPEGIQTPDLCLRRVMGLWFYNDLQASLGALAAGFTGKSG